MFRENKCLLLKISAIIFILYSCVPAAKKTDDNTTPKQAMDNTNSETKKIKTSETFTVDLKGRGALGLQLLFRTDNDSIVEVSRLNTETGNSNNISPGDSINIVYQIKAIKKGNVKITFYEKQPWNKDFKEVIQKEINVEVTE
jgi:predicted secreted protein